VRAKVALVPYATFKETSCYLVCYTNVKYDRNQTHRKHSSNTQIMQTVLDVVINIIHRTRPKHRSSSTMIRWQGLPLTPL